MKKKADQLTPKQLKDAFDTLFTSAKDAQSKKQIDRFLEELLTPSEKLMLGRRLQIAKLILAGKTHDEIGEMLEVGPNTIFRVSRWLNKQLPGYQKLIPSRRGRSGKSYDRTQPFTYSDLKRRYPMHFLLFNLAELLIKKR